jgi:hypothetical protein
MRRFLLAQAFVAITLTVAGCGSPAAAPTPDVPTAASSSPTPEPAEPECLDVPPEIAAAGLQVVGCVLDTAPNDLGGNTFHTAVDDQAAFSSAGDELTAIGMETVFCTEAPLFCGWSTPDTGYNVNLTYLESGGAYAVPVLEYETWGF